MRRGEGRDADRPGAGGVGLSNLPPSSSADLFSDEVLADPYPVYEELRAAGPVIHLDRYDAYAVPRYAEVRTVLFDWRTFSSAQGTALDPEVNRLRAGNIISTDPPQHDVLRGVLGAGLGARAVQTLTEAIRARADELVRNCLARGSFEAVTDLAQVLPTDFICDLVGFPQQGRAELLDCAHASFNTFGPMNERALAAVPKQEQIWHYLSTAGARERLADGGLGLRVYAAADAGEIRYDQVPTLLYAFASAGMETTVHAIGNVIWLLADHPAEWAKLRADPDLAGAAFREALRLESPIQLFTRVCTQGTELGGVSIPAGARVITMFGSGNRDERRWADPTSYRIDRNPVDHLAFGHGRHGCLGQTLAQVEGEAVLRSLASRVRELRAGEPVRALNNVLRGLRRLPLSVTAVSA